MRNRRSGDDEDENEAPADALDGLDDLVDARAPHGMREQRRARQGRRLSR